jgi:uncharacterized protein YjbI with pentapeptide repeats
MDWLIGQFGIDRLRTADVILPTEDFFPDAYAGSTDDTRVILDRVCDYAGLDPATIQLDFYQDRNPILEQRTAGWYQAVDGKYAIWVEQSNLHDSLGLVATMAHELAHVHLLGHGRISSETEDHERLTDLLTVFLGFGVITANAVIQESYWHAGAISGWSMGRMGYLTMPIYGYALALFARARGEEQPTWAQHLRPDVLTEFRKAQRFLAEAKHPTELCGPPKSSKATESRLEPGDANHKEEETAALEEAEADIPTGLSSVEELLERYVQGERVFENVDLPRSRLCRVDLSGSDLNTADLYNADLTEAVLLETDLHDADLRWADLHGAVLRGSNLNGADLTGAKLSNADLEGADIRGADFASASLRGANLIGVLRSRSTNFEGADFTEAVCDAGLRNQLSTDEDRSQMFAGRCHGIRRLVARIAVSCGAALVGALGGVLLGALGDKIVQNAAANDNWAKVGALLGAVVAGLWAFWKLRPVRPGRTP